MLKIKNLRNSTNHSSIFCLSVLTTITFLSSTTLAQDTHHKAHQHGVGKLNVAIAGNEAELELAVPGADIVGFEHKATTDKDINTVKNAIKKLSAGSNLFVFPAAANCKLEKAKVETELLESHESDHKESEHKHEHEHGHKEDHEKENQEEAHGEFEVHYHFDCAHPEKIDSIEVKFFEHFPSAHELDVQMISSKGQKAKELTPSDNLLKF